MVTIFLYKNSCIFCYHKIIFWYQKIGIKVLFGLAFHTDISFKFMDVVQKPVPCANSVTAPFWGANIVTVIWNVYDLLA